MTFRDLIRNPVVWWIGFALMFILALVSRRPIMWNIFLPVSLVVALLVNTLYFALRKPVKKEEK